MNNQTEFLEATELARQLTDLRQNGRYSVHMFSTITSDIYTLDHLSSAGKLHEVFRADSFDKFSGRIQKLIDAS